MSNPNERLDLSDYPRPDGYCEALDKECSLFILGKYTARDEIDCPEWQDTHDGELSYH